MAESFVDENIEIIDLKYNYSNFKVADFGIWQTFTFSMRMNFYNHHNSISFKSHSIRVTFKICAVLGAQGIRATGFKRAQGNQHCAKSESHTNRVTFETNAIMMIVKVHPQCTTFLVFS